MSSSSSSSSSTRSQLTTGINGLAMVNAIHPNSGATLQVYLYGANVTSYCPYGINTQDVLFVSSKAIFDGVKPIRGGIPIAFPQFAAQGPLPMHGFARTNLWTLDNIQDEQECTSITLSLTNNDTTYAIWPHKFRLVYRIIFNSTLLTTTLEVHNPKDNTNSEEASSSFTFEALLHSYFATGVNSINDENGGSVRINGLEGTQYLSKPQNNALCNEASNNFPLIGEVDRIYLLNNNEVTITGIQNTNNNTDNNKSFNSIRVQRKAAIRDASPGLRQVVEHSQLDVVVWNAGPVKCASIADFGPEDWHNYVCIEPGRVSKPAELAPGKLWYIQQTITPITN